MKSLIVSSLLLLLALGHATAQHITFERSYDYGFAEAAYAVIQTADGGYLMVGRQGIAPFHSKGLLIKTDEYGIEQWHNMFWAGCDTYIYDVKELDDGGFILVGDHCRPGMASNMFLARVDGFGDTLWLRSFGLPSNDRGRGVVALADGGYVFAGRVDTLASLILTDDEGNTVWQKGFLPPEAVFSTFESLALADDGSFLMCGTVHFPDLARQNMLYVVRADADGDLLWERWFGGPENDQGMAVASIPDGGVYAAGYTWSFGAGHYDMYLIRLTQDGDTLWTTTVGTQREEAAKQVFSAMDGGAVLVGDGHSGSGAGDGNYGIMVAKVDDSGELLWSERYGHDQYSMHGRGGTQASDGGHVLCGNGHSSAHLIKTDDVGKVVGIPGNVDDSDVPMLFPNPATDHCIMTLPASWSANMHLVVMVLDMMGRTVLTAHPSPGSDRISLPISHLSAGMYTVRAFDASHLLSAHKLIIR